MNTLKKGDYNDWSIGNTPMDTIIQDLINIVGEEYSTDDDSLVYAVCETLDAWMESKMKDLQELSDNIKNCIEVFGEVANKIMWYLIDIEYREGRVVKGNSHERKEVK